MSAAWRIAEHFLRSVLEFSGAMVTATNAADAFRAALVADVIVCDLTSTEIEEQPATVTKTATMLVAIIARAVSSDRAHAARAEQPHSDPAGGLRRGRAVKSGSRAPSIGARPDLVRRNGVKNGGLDGT